MAGDEGFDPLGLSNVDNAELGIDLYWMREAELKHARVAMLATLGMIAQESGFVVPGFPTTKNQITAFWECLDKNPGPIFAAVIFFGMVELISGFAITEGKKNGNREPGDFGFNPFVPRTIFGLSEGLCHQGDSQRSPRHVGCCWYALARNHHRPRSSRQSVPSLLSRRSSGFVLICKIWRYSN